MAITIPKQHFVGYRDDLGFAAPYVGDSACRKRQETIISWATNGRPPEILENDLREGFALGDSIRRRSGWGKGNVTWRITDPRGFELEITSPNLASILGCTTVVEGVIQGKCVWGRDGGVNVLLPENSEPYQEATRLTMLSKQKLSSKDYAPGDLVLLQTGEQAVYLGVYHMLTYEFKQEKGRWNNGNDPACTIEMGGTRKRHLWINVEHMTSKDNFIDNIVVDDSTTPYPTVHIETGAAIKVSEVSETKYVDLDCNLLAARLTATRPSFRNALVPGWRENVIAISTTPFGKISYNFGTPRAAAAEDMDNTSFVIDATGIIYIHTNHDRQRQSYHTSNDPRYAIFRRKLEQHFPTVTSSWKVGDTIGNRWHGTSQVDVDTHQRVPLIISTANGDYELNQTTRW